MAADLRVGLFLEDLAQAELFKSLATRIIRGVVQPPTRINLVYYNASGGKGWVAREFRAYLRSVADGVLPADIIVVSQDANQVGAAETRRKLLAGPAVEAYAGPIVCATPDPEV